MAKFSEKVLTGWSRPPSNSEETKLANAERMVKDAIREDNYLNELGIDVFGQGSYANDTNVRLNSDIDINVRYSDGFYFDLPPNCTRSAFGLDSPSTYSLEEFKNDVYTALARKFGSNGILREDKCIKILANSYHAQTDVVPTWRYHRYEIDRTYVEGTQLRTDAGLYVQNFPEQHISNGKLKNANTAKRYKRLTRIYKKLRYRMLDENVKIPGSVSSFLLESLVWNVPNSYFFEWTDWNDRLKYTIAHLRGGIQSGEYEKWTEVSGCLLLFHSGRKWTTKDASDFLVEAFNYLEY